jgi:hypothetical protein
LDSSSTNSTRNSNLRSNLKGGSIQLERQQKCEKQCLPQNSFPRPLSKLNKINSISSQSISSSFATPSTSSASSTYSGTNKNDENLLIKANRISATTTTATTTTTTISDFNNSSCSKNKSKNSCQSFHFWQNNLNKEIKNLLDIAENRTRMLCKVYDSSLTDNDNAQLTEKTEAPCLKKSGIYKSELVKLAPNDYKSIINLNYINSSKKQSNVITKVKLWDQLFLSGQLNLDKWDQEFS